VLAVALLLYLGRHLWFFYDEWDIVGNHQLPLLQPHNEHWSTLPYLAYAGLYRLFGLRTYLPYLGVVLLLHAAAAHQLWLLMRRAGVGDWLATAATTVFLVMGAGAENLVWAWQMGFVGSLCFGLLAVNLAVERRAGNLRLLGVWLALVASLMCSDIGLALVAATGIATFLSRGLRAALAALALPALVFAAWYVRYGKAPVGASYARPDPVGVARFAWIALTGALDQGAGLKHLGGLVLLLIAAWSLVLVRNRQAPAALGTFVAAFLLMTLIGASRLQFGLVTALSPRYLYLVFALLLPVGVLGLQAIARRGHLLELAVFALLAWGTIHGARTLVDFERRQRVIDLAERGHVLAVAAQLRSTSAPSGAIPERPDPVAAPTLNLSRVRQYIADGAMPSQ
jgi:hypothetical protein